MRRDLRPKGTRYAVGLSLFYVAFGLVALSGVFDSDHFVGLVIGAVLLALVGPFIWRAGVYVRRDGFTCVPVSGKPTTYSWADIKEFKVDRTDTLFGFGIHAVLSDGREVLLPATSGPSPLRPKMERVLAQLGKAKAHADAVHPTEPMHSLGRDLVAERAELTRQLVKMAVVCVIGAVCGVWAMFEGVGAIGLIAFGGAPLLVLLTLLVRLRLIDSWLARNPESDRPAG